jgi:hypothetical protein
MMSPVQQTLWNRLKAFEIGDPNASMTFTDRLARENGWALDYAVRAVHEYKRFIFLICVAGHPLTPSDEVDQVWHLHLLYTQSYWKEMCQELLGRDIHHGPTKGGQQERDKFTDWYAQTKTSYQHWFGYMPPADIWPSSEVRFSEIHFERVNMHRHWVLPKPAWLRKLFTL